MSLEEVAGLDEIAHGWPLIHRLLYIAQRSERFRQEAALKAAKVIQEHTQAVDLYQSAMQLANAPKDDQWLQHAQSKIKREHEKLIGELRMYQNNVISESIRMAYQDLGDHYRQAGKFEEALLQYEHMREYCTTNEHALEMYIRAMQAAYDLQQYATVLAYVDKAESVLTAHVDAELAVPGQNEGWRSTLAQGNSDSNPIRSLFQRSGHGQQRDAPSATFSSARNALQSEISHGNLFARVGVFRILAQLAQCDKTQPLPEVQCDATNHNTYSDLVTPCLLAWYAVLSVLSLPPCTQRKSAETLSTNEEFFACTEIQSGPRDTVQAYLRSNFSRALDLMKQNKPMLELDPILGDDFAVLLHAIESRLLARYLSAFQRTSLVSLSQKFHRDTTSIAALLVHLISSDVITARIDWQNQVVEMQSQQNTYMQQQEADAMYNAATEASILREQISLVQKLNHAE
ncbi:hypothetical protein MYAM1_003944 [Malassezia yamatoensis]|uniref:COP9 signalosome complex subunit 1 n=1 Tax=Malassezia yamatoensis TaxID=253288 RepID=A0AAJ5Z0W8_9BASI|nr:hypothetical protein MYAM1_003944 [Malassezia yamatoensis]